MTGGGAIVPAWSIDDWRFLAREVVTDPRGRTWSVALMDILGQAGDPDMPAHLLEAQYQAGRYFTLVYSPGGAIQHERPYRSLHEASSAYEDLVATVADGRYDPSQPVFRADLED